MTRLIKTFGRTHGKKLTDHQNRLIAHILPTLSPITNMPNNSHRILEIGFGAGEHLQNLAEMYPDSTIIGAEPYMNGVAGLLSRMMVLNDGARPQSPDLSDYHMNPKYKNIRIWPDDVREFLNKNTGLFDIIYVLHPDPWPKARHEKRRLLQAEFLTYLAGHLTPGGKIIFGTDHTDLFDWTVEMAKKTSLKIANPVIGSDYDFLTPPESGLDTRYREKNKFGSAHPSYLVLTQ